MSSEHYLNQAIECSDRALIEGSLIPLRTSLEIVVGETDVNFELRKLKSRLPKHLRKEGPKPNPFSPWDRQLEVACVDPDHALILNKYPVQRGHMLLITKDWAAQKGWLTLSDWRSLVRVDNDTPGLWFFNSGPIAGASQPHRHLQLLPRSKNQRTCPRDPWFHEQIASENKNTTSNDPLIKYSHVIKRIKGHHNEESSAHYLHQSYISMCRELGIGDPSQDPLPKHYYNLLMTPEWMALLRRSQEGAFGFSINGLGFAGYLLATASSDLAWLKKHGPEALLRRVVPEIRGNTVAEKSL